MKKFLLLVMSLILLASCSNEEQKISNKYAPVKKEETKSLGFDNIPDFPMPLHTFIDRYNKSGQEGFTPIEKDPSKIKFIKEKNGYSKTLIDESLDSTNYSVVAMFDHQKKFKRITYTHTIEGKPNEKAVLTLITLLDTLGIDSNYVAEFADTGNNESDITTNGYNAHFMKIKDTGFFNVSINSDK